MKDWMIEDTREPKEVLCCDECGAALEYDDDTGVWYCPECE